MDKNYETLLNQMAQLSQNMASLQDIMYAQALLTASNNPLLDESKRIELFNSAMALMRRDNDHIRQNTESQELRANLIV